MRLTTRPTTLSTFLCAIALFACDQPGQLGQEDLAPPPVQPCPKQEVPQNPFAGDLGIYCLGVSSNTGTEEWLRSMITGPAGEKGFLITWQPLCRKQGDSYTCLAPPAGQRDKGLEEYNSGLSCYILPCRGVNPSRVSWIDLVSGAVVTPTTKPERLPEVMRPGDRSPQGGGDVCFSDKSYAWFFGPPQ